MSYRFKPSLQYMWINERTLKSTKHIPFSEKLRSKKHYTQCILTCSHSGISGYCLSPHMYSTAWCHKIPYNFFSKFNQLIHGGPLNKYTGHIHTPLTVCINVFVGVLCKYRALHFFILQLCFFFIQATWTPTSGYVALSWIEPVQCYYH